MMPESTGIAELDVLLGGGIPPGSIVLIQGGPATGKTTLAAQIMAHTAGYGSVCGYACIEEDAKRSLERIAESYRDLGIGQKLDGGWIHPVTLLKQHPAHPQ